MRIVDMRITPIALSDPPLLHAAGLHAPYALRTIVELITDVGLRGIAEVPGGQAIDRALAEAKEDVVVGGDPLNWNRLKAKCDAHFGLEGAAARGDAPWDRRIWAQVQSAIDVACLDIAGKAYDAPVALLLGGIYRDRIPYCADLFYKHEGSGGDTNSDAERTPWDAARERAALDPAGIVAQANAMVTEFGFKSIKLKGGVFPSEVEIETLRALRREFGADVPLRFDPSAVWSVPAAIRWGSATESLLEYLEDPARGQDGMAAVRAALRTPLAANICTASFADLPGSVRLSSEDIILADHHDWGGLHASVELAAHCRIFGKGISMHSNSHAGISLAAMTHFGAAVSNLSHALDTHYPWLREDIIAGGRIEFEDGAVKLPSGPGLGVELDYDALALAHERYLRTGLTERDDKMVSP